MEIKRNILLNPGPATTTDTVKMAQVVPDICPREQEFGDLMRDLVHGLTALVADPENYTTVLFGGSGTSVMESMLISTCTGGKVLIINNGAYGQRMVQIAQTYGLSHKVYESSPFEQLDIQTLKSVIQSDSQLTHLCVIHHETTTGLLNDLKPLGDLCRDHNLVFLVDGISSYAGIPIDLEKSNVSFMTASSNKNIQGMAGVGIILCRKTDLAALKGKKTGLFYLDLYSQYEYFEKTGQTRFTPPVQTLYALRQALRETESETVVKRFERYSKSWEILHIGLEKLGLKYLVDKKDQSRMITTIVEPTLKGYSFNGMHDYCYQRGFTIYPGKVGGRDTFRIANIGAIDTKDISNFLTVLNDYLKMII